MSKLKLNKAISLCSIANIPIKIHITYVIFVLAITIALMATHGGPWALKIAQLLAYLFIAVLVHELGHALVALFLGHKVRSITIYPIGGLATIDILNDKSRDIGWISFGGPAANFLLFFICIFFEKMTLDSLGMLSLILGVSNLLPIKSFDGGLILYSMLLNRCGQKKTKTILYITSIFIIVIAGFLGLYMKSFVICASAVFMYIYGVLLSDNA